MELLNNKFNELTQEEMLIIEGGGWKEAGKVFVGTMLVAVSPIIAVAASPIATPVGGVAAGGAVAGLGLSLIGGAVH